MASTRFSFIPLTLLLCLSCRKVVLEDRTDCPAFIFFEKDEALRLSDKDFVKIEVRDASSLELLGSDKPMVGEILPGKYYIPIPKRKEIVTTCVSGIRMSQNTGGKLILPYGNQGDPIFHYMYREELNSEQLLVPLKMQKDHSVITVRFTSYKETFPYSIAVRANTAGIETVSGRPVEGTFRYVPLETEPGTYIFTVPRQADYSLSIEISAKPGMTPENGHIDDILLWNALQNIRGFNWEMENLPDIDVDLDITRESATVRVNGWTVDNATTISI